MSSDPIAPASEFTRHRPTLVTWEVYDPSIRSHLNSAALLTKEGWWLVDPVPILATALKQLLDEKSLLGILLTNENHERASTSLAKDICCFIYAHEATSGQMELTPDFFFQDGQQLTGGLKAIHIPGASLGETCFYDPQNRIMLLGDALINLKETGFTFLPDKYCRHPIQSKRFLRRLLDLEFDTITFAHGTPLIENAKNQLEKLLAS